MYAIYNTLIIGAGVLLVPYIAFKALTDQRYRKGLMQRFGRIRVPGKAGRRFWVHASSVGEVNVAYPFIKELLKNYTDTDVILTTVTPEGYGLAKEKLKDIATVCFSCLDYGFSVNSFLDSISPDAVFIIETEIWPNLLRALRKRGIITGIVNGRISEKSLRRYMRSKGFTRNVLKNVDFFLVQDETHKERFALLSGRDDDITVTGNIKFDIDDSFFRIDDALARHLEGIDSIVAGSTHDDEEARMISIFPGIRDKHPGTKLIIAPRHIKRCTEIESVLKENGISFIKRTGLAGDVDVNDYDVILVDTIGDLATFFRSAKIVFMGGSLVKVGGHNIIEPAYFARPVLFGPYMQNFADARELILSEEGAVTVRDETELKERIISLLGDPAEMRRIGANAKSALERNKGALKKTVTEIKKHCIIE